jgi:N-ethylmaleimide reductase
MSGPTNMVVLMKTEQDLLLKLLRLLLLQLAKDKVGIRFSPVGAFNDCMPFGGEEETYTYLAKIR